MAGSTPAKNSHLHTYFPHALRGSQQDRFFLAESLLRALEARNSLRVPPGATWLRELPKDPSKGGPPPPGTYIQLSLNTSSGPQGVRLRVITNCLTFQSDKSVLPGPVDTQPLPKATSTSLATINLALHALVEKQQFPTVRPPNWTPAWPLPRRPPSSPTDPQATKPSIPGLDDLLAPNPTPSQPPSQPSPEAVAKALAYPNLPETPSAELAPATNPAQPPDSLTSELQAENAALKTALSALQEQLASLQAFQAATAPPADPPSSPCVPPGPFGHNKDEASPSRSASLPPSHPSSTSARSRTVTLARAAKGVTKTKGKGKGKGPRPTPAPPATPTGPAGTLPVSPPKRPAPKRTAKQAHPAPTLAKGTPWAALPPGPVLPPALMPLVRRVVRRQVKLELAALTGNKRRRSPTPSPSPSGAPPSQ